MALSDSRVSADLIPSERTKPVSAQQLRRKEPRLWKNAILPLRQNSAKPPNTSHSCAPSFLRTVKSTLSLCSLPTVQLSTDDLICGLGQAFLLK